jgi:hypothetical protein
MVLSHPIQKEFFAESIPCHSIGLVLVDRALYSDFKAFRFPSTPIVNFIATVQFCQELCEPVTFWSFLVTFEKYLATFPGNLGRLR